MLSKEKPAELRETVKNLLLSTGRANIENLVDWLETGTDYFTAPAGMKYHGAFAGGLVKHSFTVLLRLVELTNQFGYAGEYDYETLVICALLHDVCKVNSYYKYAEGEKTGWRFMEQYPYGGHGGKSVYLIMRYIDLSPEEASAINCHMGAYENSDYHRCGDVYNWNPLAWLLHVADEAACYIDKL